MIVKWRLMSFYFMSIVGILIYLKGFFPVKISRVGSSSLRDIPPVPSDKDTIAMSRVDFSQGIYDQEGPLQPDKALSPLQTPLYSKLVMVVVNALRDDFVFGARHLLDTPFIRKSLLNGNGIGFFSRAMSPAVTLPRIKSLVTGSVTSYADVILSLDRAKPLKEDNIVSGAFARGKSIVFYGDEMWTDMFPGKFKRQIPVSPFFLRDFIRVDGIVEDGIRKELSHPEHFDVMIANLLGLGHIGHVVGSRSPLISEKLKEIDTTIKSIYDRLQEFDTVNGEKTLLVVTGDHGMTDKGSHGGTTQHERDVPLLFLSPGVASNVSQGDTRKEVQQVDLVSTLSVLLGIPIPRNSMGQLIEPLVQKMNPADELHSLQYNCHHLLSLAGSTGLLGTETLYPVDPVKLYWDAFKSHATWTKHPSSSKTFQEARESYTMCQNAASDLLKYHVAAYNHLWIAVGMLVALVGYLSVTVTWAQIVLVPQANPNEDSHARNSPLTWGVLATVGTVLHSVSLLSSSYLEEEHQTWYYMTATFLAVLFLNVINETVGVKLGMAESMQRGIFSKGPRDRDVLPRYRTDQMELLRRAKSEDSVDSTWDFVELEASDDEATFDRTTKKGWKFSIPDTDRANMAVLALAMLSHRLLRAWNSTGIQNVDEADIGDWLNDPGNEMYLALSHLVGLCFVAILLEALSNGRDKLRTGLLAFGLVMVFVYRLGAMRTMSGMGGLRESVPPILTYIAIAAILSKAAFLLSKRSKATSGDNIMDYIMTSVVLASVLLSRAHNVWPVVLNLFLYWSVFRRLWPIVGEDSGSNMQLGKIVLRTTLCYWFGQMSYFSTGNSNSLATIDVSAGYVGISTHYGTLEDTFVRLLIVFATYTGPILWTMLCLVDTVKVSLKEFTMSKQSSWRGLLAVFSTFAFLRLTSASFYLVLATIMRYHLFVWSVFAPKLLYESASTVVYGCMLLAASVAAKCIK